jgi:hypothetical protein
MRPPEASGDPHRHREDFGRVTDPHAGAIDHRPHRSRPPATRSGRAAPLLLKWLEKDPNPMSASSVISWMLARSPRQVPDRQGQPPDPKAWLRAAEVPRGQLWPDYGAGVAERCGVLVDAPARLGGHGLDPPGDPGTYVFEPEPTDGRDRCGDDRPVRRHGLLQDRRAADADGVRPSGNGSAGSWTTRCCLSSTPTGSAPSSPGRWPSAYDSMPPTNGCWYVGDRRVAGGPDGGRILSHGRPRGYAEPLMPQRAPPGR